MGVVLLSRGCVQMSSTTRPLISYSIIPNFLSRLNVQTVQSLLQDSGASGMLRDPLLYESTRALDHVLASELQQAAARKEKARKELCSQYASETFLEAEVMRVVHSVSDAQAYEATATYPVKRMLHYLTTYFDRNEPGAKHGNLALRFGEGGSKLSHSHATQYSFVYQVWKRKKGSFSQ